MKPTLSFFPMGRRPQDGVANPLLGADEGSGVERWSGEAVWVRLSKNAVLVDDRRVSFARGEPGSGHLAGRGLRSNYSS